MLVIRPYGHWEISLVCEIMLALGRVLDLLGDGSDLRDYVIKCGIIQPLIALIKQDIQVELTLHVCDQVCQQSCPHKITNQFGMGNIKIFVCNYCRARIS